MLIGSMTVLSVLIAVGIGLGTGASGLTWLWLIPAGFVGSFLALFLVAFLFLWGMSAIIDVDKPQEHDSKFYRNLMGLYVPAILRITQVRMHVEGLEKAPKEGRFLLVCNHLNEMDPVVLLHYFRKSQLAFISKRENTNLFIVGKIMHRLLTQMINRENDREALKTILRCIQLLKEDEASVAVFPEGYIKGDNKLHRFRAGVFKIALKANVPIVVCTLQNTQDVFHNAKRLRPTDVHLHLVGVVPAEEIKGRTAVDVSNQVYQMMRSDLGDDLVAVEEDPAE